MSQNPDCANISAPTVHRHTPKSPRDMRMVLYRSAREAVGELTPGCNVFGFTKGQFSLTDIICELLAQTGPADVSISTWTAARQDIGHCFRVLEGGLARSMRWVIDRSFPTRQPEYLAALVDRFGADCVRVTRTHAKFVLIRNEKWNIVLRSSMNLNKNPRFENYEFSDDADFADFFETIVDEVFTNQSVGAYLTAENEEFFRTFRAERYDPAPAGEPTQPVFPRLEW